MNGLVVLLLYALALALIGMMLVQGLSRRVDLLSIRNLYLASFIIYQIASPASALSTGNFSGFQIADATSLGKLFLLYAYAFTAVYLLSYHRLHLSDWLTKKFSGISADVPDSLLTGLAIATVLIALPLRFLGARIALLGGLSSSVSFSMAAIACAIAGWVWGHRRFNFAVIAMAAVIFAVSLVIAMYGSYSRRPLLGILMGFCWGAYYRWARHISPKQLLIKTAPLVLGGMLVLSAFTAIRSHKSSALDVREVIRKMAGADVKTGAKDVLGGQSCGAASLWALEQYPDYLEPKPLFSLQYMFYYYVPRKLWPEKPDVLSNHVASLANIKGVNQTGITIPPGVIGYAAAEGGFYALIIYAIFFGQFSRFFDDFVRRNPGNAFIILPIGSAIGQFLGLARGDIAVMTNMIVVGFVSTFLLMLIAKKMFGRPTRTEYWIPVPQPR